MCQDQGPAWPTWDLIVRSLNARSNILGRIGDDPLAGVALTPEMIDRARRAAFPTTASSEG